MPIAVVTPTGHCFRPGLTAQPGVKCDIGKAPIAVVAIENIRLTAPIGNKEV